MIIDCHTHLGSHNNRDFEADDLLNSMRRAGVEYSLVIANRTRGEGLTTDDVIQITKKNPKLKAIGNIEFDTLDLDQIEKLKGYLKDRKIFGVKLYLGYEEFYADDPKLSPLYKFCEKQGYPVVYHTGVLEVGYKGLLKYSHPLTIDNVAASFPNLKIVIAHMGNPWILDCGAVMLKNDNVYMDLSGFFDEYKSIAKEQVNFFIKRLWEFRQFVREFKKCLFGTDYPLYSQKEYLDAALKLPLDKEDRDLVFWKNAKEIFNLDI
ncbi:MAG: hypothetical protein A3F31_00190 [Candidatus Levybacteria bacterium RIFCSPHIGHO2_12_FULL_38_12]|nr:MAG: hypothetical protein A2770_02700 [Candidatus Levybacteria bacterium RIFCSPHIGHO2_01_FULL_38_12]OGH22888.1 MAG: hypothetical protein A3F31_00190 [Candidatus Levybacteria bacterium RIFCSPHIGHO2_12_FULL_38_12]